MEDSSGAAWLPGLREEYLVKALQKDGLDVQDTHMGWAGAYAVRIHPTSTVQADEWNKKTVLTFSQPVEIPGHVLPAGTYTCSAWWSIAARACVARSQRC